MMAEEKKKKDNRGEIEAKLKSEEKKNKTNERKKQMTNE